MTTRRGLFGWLAGGLAAAHLPWGKAPLASVEFNDIVRRAFVPKVSAQLYSESPFVSMIIHSPGKGYTSPPTISFTGEPDGP